jgi:hypothetical protein
MFDGDEIQAGYDRYEREQERKLALIEQRRRDRDRFWEQCAAERGPLEKARKR